MKHVLSTATSSTKFQDHKVVGDMPTVVKSVMVYGGANLPSAKSGFGEHATDEGGHPLWTPRGVVTPVSDEDAKFLAAHRVFQAGVEAGFYVIMDSDPGQDHKKVAKLAAAELTAADKSAPLTKDTMKSKVAVSTIKVE